MERKNGVKSGDWHRFLKFGVSAVDVKGKVVHFERVARSTIGNEGITMERVLSDSRFHGK